MNQLISNLLKPIIYYYLKVKYFFIRISLHSKNRKSSVYPSPIFILGHQKSGTTVIAALLAKLANLSITLDFMREIDDPIYSKVYLGQLEFSQFIEKNRYHFSREIIKEANLTILYPILKENFEESKFIFIVRDPRDTIRSILNRLNLPGNLESLTKHQQKYLPPGWSLILNGKWMGLEGKNYIELLAQRWCLFVDIYLKYKSDLVLVSYEEFNENKNDTIIQLANSLNLEIINDISSQVDLQFQSKGDNEVKWEKFFGRENLKKIEKICDPKMQTFGYYPTMGNSF